jgi:hypothetical protein
MSRFSNPDRIPEDESVFYPDFEEEEERAPRRREPELPRCVNCLDREVTDDGYGEWVHADDIKYSCTYGQKPKTTLFASPLPGWQSH